MSAAGPADDDDSTAIDPVAEILAEWRVRRDAGEDVTIEDLAREHPDVAGALRRRAAALDLAAARLRGEAPERELSPVRTSRYRDFRPAGEGGMGIVYWALDTELNREVAFKIVRPNLAEQPGKTPAEPLGIAPPERGTPASTAFETLKSRFLQEAWVTAGMAHPGIVPVYELGATPEGVPYFTMRFVRGRRTLGDAIDEAAEVGMEARLALLEPFLKVCDTVRYAHSRGVVHRDLKPANIALGEFGEVVVLDWGLAKVADRHEALDDSWHERMRELKDERDLKTLASALGTPGYMSPEAALGRLDEIDRRSDAYSLGAILYKILTGRLPFVFETYGDLVRQMLAGAPPEPTSVDPSIPEGLSRICTQALAKNRDARQDSVDVMAAQIRNWQIERDADRETDRLVHEAATCLVAAGELAGDDRLRQLDRCAAAVARAREIRPSHPDVARIEAEVDALRRRGVEERERTARRRTFRRVTTASLAVAAVAAVVVAGVIDGKRREADAARAQTADALVAEKAARDRAEQESLHARALALAHASAEHVKDEPMLALLLARDSARVRRTPAAVAALRAAVAASHERLHVTADGSMRCAAVARDAETLVVGTAEGALHAWRRDGTKLCSTPARRQQVTALDVSADGELVVAGYADGVAEIRRTDGSLVAELPRHASAVTIAQVAASGDRVLTFDGGALPEGPAPRKVRLGDTAGREIASFETASTAAAFAGFVPDGSRILVLLRDGSGTWLDGRGAEMAARFRVEAKGVKLVRPTTTGDRLAVLSTDGSVQVFDDAGRALFTVEPRAKTPAVDARFSPDGKLLLVNGWNEARVFDEGGHETATVTLSSTGISLAPVVHAMAFSPDGRRFALATSDLAIHVHAADGREEAVLRGHRDRITFVRFADGGRSLVTVAADEAAKRWDLVGAEDGAVLEHAGPVLDAKWSPDGSRIVTASNDRTARVWSDAGAPLAVLRGHTDAVVQAAFLPGGERIVTASADGTARLFESDGREAAVLAGHEKPIWSMAVSADGQRVATGSADGTARLWDADGRLVAKLDCTTREVARVAFSPDGRLLATGATDYTTRIWDARTGAAVATLEGGHTGRVAFSPDSTRLVTSAGFQDVRIATSAGDPVADLTGHTLWITDVAFSPDGRAVVSASLDRTARIWDLGGHCTAVLSGHLGGVIGAAFCPDGGRVLTTSDDGTARLWAVDGRELTVFAGHTARVFSARLSPDGRRLLTASDDGTARLFLVRDEDLVALADRRVTRDYTRGELERLGEVLGPAAARRLAAYRLADERIARHVLVEDALASVTGDASLDADLRRETEAMLHLRHDDADALNAAAWDAASRPGLDAAAYRRAVRLAEAAERLRPGVGQVVNTVGAARYRAGDLPSALAALERSDRLGAEARPPGDLEDAVFLALTKTALGRADDAAKDVARARAILALPESPDRSVTVALRALVEEAAKAVEAARGVRPPK